MANYKEAKVKLSNTQLNKLTSAAKKKTEIILKSNNKTLKMKNRHMNYF